MSVSMTTVDAQGHLVLTPLAMQAIDWQVTLDEIIKEVVPLLDEGGLLYDPEKYNDDFYQLHYRDVDIYLKMHYSSKRGPFFSIRGYRHYRLKTDVRKRNFIPIDGNRFDLGQIRIAIEDIALPIMAIREANKVRDSQSQKMENFKNEMNRMLGRRQCDFRLSWVDRGSEDSKMVLTVNNLDEDEVRFLIQMFAMVSN